MRLLQRRQSSRVGPQTGAYPLADGARPQLSAGLDNQETVGLTVFQVTSRGQLGVHIHLAAIDHDAHSPTSGIASSAHMLLLTSYNALQHFAADPKQLSTSKAAAPSVSDVESHCVAQAASPPAVLVRHAARPTRARRRLARPVAQVARPRDE